MIINTAFLKIRKSTMIIILGLLFILLNGVRSVYAADRFCAVNGPWNSTATWSTTSAGGGGASIPVAGDNVYIELGRTVTVNITNAECSNLYLGRVTGTTAGTGTLTFASSGSPSIAVSGNTKLGGTSNNSSHGYLTFTSGSSMSTGTLTMGETTRTSRAYLSMAEGGTLTMNGAFILLGSGTKSFTRGTGTVIMNATNTLPSTVFTNFHHFRIAGGVTSLSANLIRISGSLTVDAGTTLAMSSFTLGSSTRPPSVTLYCGSSVSGSSITGTGLISLGGNVSVYNLGTGNNGASISNPVALIATRTFTVEDDGTSAVDLSLGGVLSGTSIGITKQGAGTLLLSGPNTYSGATLINVGTLRLGNAAALGTSSATTVVDGATLDLNGTTLSTARPLTLNGTGITESGALMNSLGTGATYSGIITFNATASIVGGSGTITISGIPVSGTTGIILGGSAGGAFSTAIAGARTLTKEGSGTWLLSGTNTYSGATSITEGTLKLNSTTALGTSSLTTVSDGATLDLNGRVLSTARPLTLNGFGVSNGGALINNISTAITYSGAITLGSASSIGTTGNITLGTSGITGGGNLTKVGGGVLNLGSGTSTLGSLTISTGTLIGSSGTLNLTGNFTNNSTFTHNSGTVNFNGTSQTIGGSSSSFNNITISSGTTTLGVTTPSVSGALTVNAGATLALSSYALGGTANPTSLTMYCGAATASSITGTGTLSLGGTVNVIDAGTGTNGATISSPIALGAARIFAVANDGTSGVDLTISGNVSGPYAITKNGDGTILLSGTNSYTGTTSINQGILSLGNSSALGTGSAASVSNGATLDLNGINLSTAISLNINGLGVSNGGALMNSSATAATYNGAITLAGISSIGATGNVSLGSSGIIGGFNLTKVGGGILNLGSGTSTLGVLTISEGTLTGTSGTMNLSGNLTNNGTFTHNNGTVNFNGTSHSIGGTSSTSFKNLTISSGILTAPISTLNIAGNFTNNATFTHNGGTVNFNGISHTIGGSSTTLFNNLTISSGTLTASSGSMNIAGNFTNNATFTHNGGTVNLNGALTQTIGGISSTTFNNLNINNVNGVMLDIAQSVNGVLTLTNGRLTLGAFNLTLGSAAVAGTGFGVNKMIVADGTGELRRIFTSNGSYVFPVGDATVTAEYSPVTLNFASGTYSSAYASVRVTNAKHPNNASATNYLNRYWTIGSSGITSFSCTVTGTYVVADISGTEGSQAAGKYGGALPWTKYTTLGSNTLTASGVTDFGAFTGITAAAPTVSISANPGLSVFYNSSLTLTANPVGDPTFTYSWSPGGATSQAINPSTTISGDYTVIVTDGNGFTGTETVTVVVLLPLELTATSGNTGADYLNLKDAFDKINDGTHQGNITIKVKGNTTETAISVLNESSGSASYTSVLIYPILSGLSISGSLNSELIKLNGADNVTFDGRVNATGSSVDFVLQNTNTGLNAVTLLLDNSAQTNLINYCTIKGGGGSSSNGTVLFGTTGSNISNTLSHNEITNNGTRRINAIYSVTGTNTGNTVSNNNLYDNWSAAASSYSLNLGAGTSNWTITGNSVFETSTFTPSGTFDYYGFYISSASGNNFSLTSNYFGGQSPQCTGAALTMGSTGINSTLNPIYLNVGSSTNSSIQGNTLSKINLSSSASTPFYGIYANAGAISIGNVSGNAIGDTTGTGSITLTSGSLANSYGIYVNSPNIMVVSNNRIGSITLATTTNAHGFTGIHKSAVAGQLTLNDNTIGSIGTPGSIVATAGNDGIQQNLTGIYLGGTGTGYASRNVISNLLNITNNNNSYLYGIACGGSGTTSLTGNFIYKLNQTSTSLINILAGIYTNSGTNTIVNNIVSIGDNITSGLFSINGILSNGTATDFIYHNTISLSGTITGATTVNTAAYRKKASAIVTVNNNIFTNIRSGGSGTGRHSAIAINNTTGVTCDYNLLYAPNTNGVTGVVIISDVNSTPYPTLVDWQTSTSIDLNSIDLNPLFSNPISSSALDYKPNIDLTGKDLLSLVPYDYSGAARTSYPTLGVWERPLALNVEVYSGAVLQNSYINLKSAFDKINSGVHTGNLTVKIIGNPFETRQAKLNASGTSTGGGTSNYSGVNIYPTNTGLTISGSLNTDLINLNGADNVIIDGRVNADGSTPDLTIINTSIASGSVTIKLDSSAQSNTVRYCTLKGGGVSSTNGTIQFGNTGNNISNSISYNNITNNGTRRTNALYAAGGTNTGNTVSNNNFYDNWSDNSDSYSVNLSNGTSDWTISGNSFYAASSYTSGAYSYYGIRISNTSGNNFTITDNFIGGQSALCGGSAFSMGTASSVLYPIYLNVGTSTASSVQGNTIKNIAYTSSDATPFYGIYLAAGAANIGTVNGNAIGDSTTTASVTLTGSNTNTTSYGIYIAGSGTVAISNNNIGSITAANTTAANAHNFFGIYMANVAGSLTISSNKIGSSLTSASLRTSSIATGNAQSLYGIYSEGTGIIAISGNIISNLTNSTTNANTATTGKVNGIVVTAGTETISDNTICNLTIENANNSSIYTASVGGIVVSGSNNKVVRGNTIYGLSNTSGSFSGNILGLYFSGGTGGNSVSDNFIRNLSVSSVNGFIYGIKINSGSTTYSNNIISLSNAIDATIYGFYETGTTGNNNNLYYNSVYISGTLSSGTKRTYALYSAVNTNTRIFRNNLLNNARSTTGGTNLHFAIYYAATGGFTANYNDYIASGTGGVLCFYNVTYATTISSLRVATGQDGFSINTNPQFLNESGSYAYITDFKTNLNLVGTPVSGVTTDINQKTRSSTVPTIGAWEYFVNIYVYSGTTLVANFMTLQATFNAINNATNGCSGNLTVKINTSTTETATATLNASGSGSANYSRVYIYPAESGLSISGSIAGALINLNGADKVCFDGRVNGVGTTRSLTIRNTNVGTSSITIQLNNAAQNDTIKYCHVLGGGGTTTNATVLFGTTGANSNNVIDNCEITNNGTRRSNGIYSVTGTNSGIIISNNKFYDTWLTSASSYFVNLGAGTTGWIVSGNSFYETASFQPLGVYTYSAVYLNNTSSINHLVSGNYIGGQDSLCGGSSMLLGTEGTARSLTFYPIYINVGTATPTSIQGNIIRNISYRSSSTTPFSGIYANAGVVNIGTISGNFIGDSIGTGSVNLISTVRLPVSYGIYLGSTDNLVVSNNKIGALSTNNSNVIYRHSFYGIYKPNQAGTVTISNNKIGSDLTPNSIQTISAATDSSQVLYGIYSSGTGNITISGNTVANLTNLTTETDLRSKLYGIFTAAGTNLIQDNIVHDLTTGGSGSSGNYENVTMTGIYQWSMTSSQNIIGNKVYNLASTTADAVEFYGILHWGSTNGNDTIARNFIFGFKMLSTSPVTYLHGLSLFNRAGTFTGTTTVANNIVFLGDSITTGCYVFGIVKNSTKAMNFFHNTIHLGGTVGDGSTTSSYAYRDKTGTAPALRDIRNNIFYNTRSGGGSNYAIYFNVLGNITVDYNDYGWSGTYFAEIATPTSQLVTLQQWLELMSGQDTHSLIINPQFVKIDGIQTTDYKTYIGLDGIPGTGINTDFAGLTRSNGNPTMGAWECFPVDVYNGSTFRSSYFTLGDAFNSINNGTWQNNLVIKMKGSTLETTTAVLNASGTGSSNYSKVVVYPIRSEVIIKGDLNSNLIQFNGADNVTFDGRIDTLGMTADMTISNLNTGTNAGTIQFTGSANNNTLNYCNIRGAGTGTTTGTVNFSDAGSGAGNDGNKIQKSVITGNTLTNRPVNSIYSSGTVGSENSGNIITENSILNNWRTASSSYSINLGPGTTDWTISGNSFYDTTAFVPAGAYTYSAIYLNNTLGINHLISGNYIGGRMAQCLGSAMTIGSTTQPAVFYPIYLNVGNTTSSSIQGNLITNLTYSSSATNPFAGIFLESGSVNVGNTLANTLGAVTGNNAVTITASAAGALSYGMYIGGTGTKLIYGNYIGSVTSANNAGANAHSFYGIYTTGSGSNSINSNIIGSTSTVGSVRTNSVASGNPQMLSAIYSNNTGTDLIKENTITNLLNSSTNNVVGNHISGAYHGGTGAVTIIQNYISNLASAATGTATIVAGIYLNTGSSIIANNVLNLGSNSLGYNLLYGIYEAGVSTYTNSVYHNTVYLSGTVSGTASAALTYAFFKLNNIGTSNIKNNIFYNARSSGSASSKHYAIRLPGVTTLFINGNDYMSTGTYGVLARMNVTDMTTLTLWKNATSQDINSINSTPGFLNAGGTSAFDYKIGAVLSGVSGTGITIDFGGNSRDNLSPTMGAWEYSLCVEVYNGTTLRGAYATLKGAFDKINDGTWTGDLIIKIYKSTYETATAALMASGSGPTYSKVHVYPVRDSVTVAGSMNAPLVNINGADYVIIDGRVEAIGSTPSITFSNTSTGTSASTIQFSESAQNDSVKYCYVKGAGLGSAIGTINFATSASGTGNSNNVITNCMISGQNSSESPVNAIYSAGTSGRENTANIISNNNIFNFVVPGTASNAIHIGSNSTAYTISNNSFYGTAVLTTTAAVEYAIIRINNTLGNTFSITNNYIGGNAPLCSGKWTKIGNNNTFYGMYFNVGSSTATNIQNNLITNLSFTNSGNANWTGIHVAGGLVNIGTVTANTIGASTGTGSITIINGASGGNVYGIAISGTNAVTCQNNIIGSITPTNSTQANATNFYGIYKGSVAGNLTISDNIIGSTSTENSLQASSNAYANSQFMYGIYSAGTGTTSISGNTIANMSNLTVETTMSSQIIGIHVAAGANTIQNNIVRDIKNGGAASGGSGTSAPNIGICNLSATANQDISGNTITRLTNTSTAMIYMYGLYYNGPTSGTNTIYRNFINRLLIPVAPPESYIQGMTITRGTGTVYNNIVAIGDSIAKGCTLYGMMVNNTSAMTIYHNTIYIGGTVAAAVSPTYAFRDETVTPSGARNVRNNIFANYRSGGGTHYAIFLASNSALTINYNDYYAGGTNGVLGYLTTARATLFAWQTATGQDGNSINTSPLFVLAGSTSPTDYTPTASLSGLIGLGITIDYSGTTRQTPPTIGALEFMGYYWTGNLDTDWNKPSNWLPQMVPTISVHANIPQRTNQPNINSGVSAQVKSVLIYTGAIVTINGGGSLTIATELINNAGSTGLVINSTADGTGSFIYEGSNVTATVKRFIAGDSAAWHFLSTPVSGQAIHGTDWTPAGNYGDGTGYDMYVWDEPTSCWVYNLNTIVAPTWTSVHPQNNFVPGRGYLYALLDSIPTKQFVGTLNNGNLTQALTILSDSVEHKGFNFIGNPYPSSIDWTIDAGFTRSMLNSNGGGYDIWTWSYTANNYGVFNSADPDGLGTNNISRYIAPMQGFFVYATSAGTFGFNNGARVHTAASNWLKSAPVGSIGAVKLNVSSDAGNGSDEVKLRFGYTNNSNGALKMYSHVRTAPSLYINSGSKKLTIQNLTNAEENPRSEVSFKAGKDGNYKINCQYDPSITTAIYLEDKQTGTIHDFNISDTYSFNAKVGDTPNRFILHYGSVKPDDIIETANIYINSGNLVVDLLTLNDEYELQVYDLNGRTIAKRNVSGGEKEIIPLSAKGLYVVSLRSQSNTFNTKVVY